MKNCKTCQIEMCSLQRGLRRLIIPELGEICGEAVLRVLAKYCKHYTSQEETRDHCMNSYGFKRSLKILE